MSILLVFAAEESIAPGTGKEPGNKTQWSSTSVSKQSRLIIA